MIETFMAFVLALVIGPVVQLFLAWVLVELLFWAARWLARRIWRRHVMPRWAAFVAKVRMAAPFTVTIS